MIGDVTLPSPAATSPGMIIAGKYVVEDVIGSGGMGVIVAARHQTLGQRVAIKLMTHSASVSPAATQRFLREAQHAARLRSEHVARVFDIGTLPSGEPYIVMELLEGTDLAGLLRERGALPPSEAIELVAQACEAIAEAHGAGIVHRDLKPANLFVTSRADGSALVKVLDFGISKAMAPDENLSLTTGAIGSPLYMSPEQVRDAKDVDQRSDIWALGMILYELCAGIPPFRAETVTGISAAITADAPNPLMEYVTGAPEALFAIVDRCLQKKREARYASVDELLADLEPLRPYASKRSLQLAALSAGPVSRAAEARRLSPSSDQTAVDVTGLGVTELGATRTAGNSNPVARRRWGFLAVAGAALALAVAAFALQRDRQRPADPASRGATFTLSIDSSPSGAEVREGSAALGVTPLQLQLDVAAVTRAPRAFVLHKVGYEPYALTQGASSSSVRVLVPLTPDAPSASGASTAAAPATGEAAPRATTGKAPPAAPSSRPAPGPAPSRSLDIVLTR